MRGVLRFVSLCGLVHSAVGGDPIVDVHSPGDAEQAYYNAGIISVALYGLFSVCCLWRSYIAFPKFKRSFENKKMIIHATLTLCGIFQTIYGISFILYKRDTVWGYSFHMFGQYCALTSFSLIPLIWTKILSYGGNYRVVRVHIAVVLFGNFAISVIQMGFLYKTNSVYDTTEEEERITITRGVILSLSLMSFSVWLLAYGVRIYHFLSSNEVRSNDIIRHERRKAILRVIFVVLACSICYIIRAFCVTLILYDYIQMEYNTDKWFSHIGWYLCSQWIPTLIPAWIMLYVCRPIPRVKHPGSHELHLRSNDSSYGEDGHFNDRLSSISQDSSNIFRASSPENVRLSNFPGSSSDNTGKPNSSSDSSRFGPYFERYSNDMYNDFEDIASYDYDPDVTDASTPGKPFTVDEILQSSGKYGASTFPFEEASPAP